MKNLDDPARALGATLLRKVAVGPGKRPADATDEQFAHETEACFRCAQIPGLKSEISEGQEKSQRGFRQMRNVKSGNTRLSLYIGPKYGGTGRNE
jgi:hypothetical protein